MLPCANRQGGRPGGRQGGETEGERMAISMEGLSFHPLNSSHTNLYKERTA